MKLQRTPLILLAVALALGGGVYFYETQVKSKQEAIAVKADPLFPFKEEDVQSFSLTTQAQALSFAKTAAAGRSAQSKPDQSKPNQSKPNQSKPDQAKSNQSKPDQKPMAEPSSSVPTDALVWRMVAPTQTYAEPAAVAYLLNLMASGKREQTFAVSATRRAEFGFDRPLATAEVKLGNQQTHRLVLGKPNFDRSALYAQVDPPTNPNQDLTVLLVSIDFENAVSRPLAEWQVKQTPSGKPSSRNQK